jgi:hypothetical protein
MERGKKKEAKTKRKNENRKLGVEGKNFEFFSVRIKEEVARARRWKVKESGQERKRGRNKGNDCGGCFKERGITRQTNT